MIEQAENLDLQAIVSMWEEISIKEFSHYIGLENVLSFINSGELYSESARLLGSTYVFRSDNTIHGFIVILDDLIELCIVRPEHQRTGVGRSLYEFAARLIEQRYNTIRAECFAENVNANSILVQVGFRHDGQYQDEMGFMTNTYSKDL